MPNKLLPPPPTPSTTNVSAIFTLVPMVTTGTSAFELSAGESEFSWKFDVTRQLFSALLKARGESRDRLYAVLLEFTEPDTLLQVALSEYDQHGNEDRLALAASLLADMGLLALPALRVLVESRSPLSGMFIHVIIRLHGISAEERLKLLILLASNPNVYVRYNLLDEILTLPTHEAVPILQLLLNDVENDISEQAQSYLNSLPS